MFKRFTRAVFRDLGMKAVALVIAVLLWNYANARVKSKLDMYVPLDIKVPEQYIKLHQSDERVSLLVRGPRELIARLSTRPAYMGLRLAHVIAPSHLDERGHIALEVDPRTWRWHNLGQTDLAQLSFDKIEPEKVSVYASREVDWEVSVKVQTVGTLRDGYAIRPTPSSVTVRGPALLLDQMTEISTRTVSLYGRGAGMETVALERQVSFSLPDGTDAKVTLAVVPSQVTVEIVRMAEHERGADGLF